MGKNTRILLRMLKNLAMYVIGIPLACLFVTGIFWFVYSFFPYVVGSFLLVALSSKLYDDAVGELDEEEAQARKELKSGKSN